jgi:hypothetical protein
VQNISAYALVYGISNSSVEQLVHHMCAVGFSKFSGEKEVWKCLEDIKTKSKNLHSVYLVVEVM